MASDLRYTEILPYEKQVEMLCSKGFALWDVVQSCRRKGSLDQNIIDDTPNDIRGFCLEHSSIQRIVFSNGFTTCVKFKRHFAAWLDSGEVVPSDHPQSQLAFKKWSKSTGRHGNNHGRRIICISALAVSPAAAKFTYREKRDFWEEYVYGPGLQDFEEQQQAAIIHPGDTERNKLP